MQEEKGTAIVIREWRYQWTQLRSYFHLTAFTFILLWKASSWIFLFFYFYFLNENGKSKADSSQKITRSSLFCVCAIKSNSEFANVRMNGGVNLMISWPHPKRKQLQLVESFLGLKILFLWLIWIFECIIC